MDKKTKSLIDDNEEGFILNESGTSVSMSDEPKGDAAEHTEGIPEAEAEGQEEENGVRLIKHETNQAEQKQ